jgi:imidazolonepropionase-like amidohydrolase
MSRTLFANVQVIDGSGGEPFAGEVMVDGCRIAAVATAGRPLPRDGARVVDGAGMTLMPGLVEAHAHLSFLNLPTTVALGEVPAEEHTLRTMANARALLDHGFTSCCSAASAKARLDVVIRNAIDAGDIPGPRLLAATPELTVAGGLGDVDLWHLRRDSFAIVCDGADEFRRVAREMCREGVDTLKINISGDAGTSSAPARETVMTEAEVAAVCEVAQSRDKRVAAHCRSAGSVKLALKHGVELIYHATLADDEALDGLVAARERVFVVPTLGITYAALYEAAPWGVTTAIAEARGMRQELERGSANMKALAARGVRVLPGGDYGFAYNPIPRNARDLEHFVNLLDFTPMQAIVAGTRLGGEIMMMGDRLGRVQEGCLADLLLVRGNPLADIAILQDADSLAGIMQDGRFHKDPGASATPSARLAAE